MGQCSQTVVKHHTQRSAVPVESVVCYKSEWTGIVDMTFPCSGKHRYPNNSNSWSNAAIFIINFFANNFSHIQYEMINSTTSSTTLTLKNVSFLLR